MINLSKNNINPIMIHYVKKLLNISYFFLFEFLIRSAGLEITMLMMKGYPSNIYLTRLFVNVFHDKTRYLTDMDFFICGLCANLINIYSTVTHGA